MDSQPPLQFYCDPEGKLIPVKLIKMPDGREVLIPFDVYEYICMKAIHSFQEVLDEMAEN
jgi:hypothetical protein